MTAVAIAHLALLSLLVGGLISAGGTVRGVWWFAAVLAHSITGIALAIGALT